MITQKEDFNFISKKHFNIKTHITYSESISMNSNFLFLETLKFVRLKIEKWGFYILSNSKLNFQHVFLSNLELLEIL